MSAQSTRHIMMMEPLRFHANEQTKATNSYQHDDDKDIEAIHEQAAKEFRGFRDLLVQHGVIVTTALGQKESPDDIFCNNWVSTHERRRMVLYPMLAKNRSIERQPRLIESLQKMYDDVFDFSDAEEDGMALESTGALCLDRVNKIAYSNNSTRSYEEVAQKWAKKMDYELVRFDTEHNGIPVYHADVMMWIGTNVAGICPECVTTPGIVDRLKKNRDVIEFTNDQMAAFCGNALEVLGTGDERMLTMSKTGVQTLTSQQKDILGSHYKTIIAPKIPTIEYYGGGSARCMMLEMF